MFKWLSFLPLLTTPVITTPVVNFATNSINYSFEYGTNTYLAIDFSELAEKFESVGSGASQFRIEGTFNVVERTGFNPNDRLYNTFYFECYNNDEYDEVLYAYSFYEEGFPFDRVQTFYNSDDTFPVFKILCRSECRVYSVGDNSVSCPVHPYVVDVPSENFGNLILTVVDTPIYILYRMFNFEILGINLWILFSGLITTLICAFIVKKIV